MTTQEPREYLYYLIDRLVNGKIDADTFCSEYERTYNLELEEDSINEKEKRVFSRLFEDVAHYSPVPEDRAKWPAFRDETAILESARQAWVELGRSDSAA